MKFISLTERFALRLNKINTKRTWRCLAASSGELDSDKIFADSVFNLVRPQNKLIMSFGNLDFEVRSSIDREKILEELPLAPCFGHMMGG